MKIDKSLKNISIKWIEKELGEVASFFNGKAHEKEISNDGKYTVINSKFVSTNGLVAKYTNACLSPLKKGDIAMVMSDVPNGKAIAKCFLVDNDNKYTLNQRIGGFRSNEINNSFLYFLLNRNKYFLAFDDGVNQTNLRKEDILECPLYYPPLSEQNRIVAVLETWDKVIERLVKKIEIKKKIKKGLMQKLLTGKFRLPGFTDKWQTIELINVLDYEQPTPYIVKNKEYSNEYKTPVLTANKSFILGYTNETGGIYNNPPAIIFDDFTTDSKYVDFPFKVKSSAIKILKTKNKKTNLKFIFEKMRMINYIIGGHKRHYISEYQYITLDIPSIIEQDAIANVLMTADYEVKTLEQKLKQLKNQKKYLLNNLITGVIRTPETMKINS
jgi:type I restriction enzyme S subunit